MTFPVGYSKTSGQRFPWPVAMQVAEEIVYALRPACERIEIAGSLRRKKPDVGDIELLYVSTMQEEHDLGDFFSTRTVSLVDGRIDGMLRAGILEKRLNAKGSATFGAFNKLLRHVASAIPVDLFATTQENWFNYLVCRTGPAELNRRICKAAIAKGWHWMPYGLGFSRKTGACRDLEIFRIESERALFEFVGIPYLEPEQRR